MKMGLGETLAVFLNRWSYYSGFALDPAPLHHIKRNLCRQDSYLDFESGPWLLSAAFAHRAQLRKMIPFDKK